MNIWIICGSITYAIKAKEVLDLRNVRSVVQKAPLELYHFGCNYGVRLCYPAPQAVLGLLRSCGIKVGAAFYETPEGYIRFDGGERE